MYEIKYTFHVRNDDGKYNTDETDTVTKTLKGRKGDEVPLERVAAAVMGEMARRDIWIINVEIAELAKRPVTFKETKGGFVLKNRKFQLGDIQGELVSEEVEEETKPSPGKVPALPTKNIQEGPLRQEVFRPNREDVRILKNQGVMLTYNRPYPVFKEVMRSSAEPIHYVVGDDSGNRIEISSTFFEPVRRGLVGMGGDDQLDALPDNNLMFMNSSPIAGSGGGGMDNMIAAQDAALMRRGA